MISQFKKNTYQWSPLAIVIFIALGCVSLPGAKNKNALVNSRLNSEPISNSQQIYPVNVKRAGAVIQELDFQYGRGGMSLSRDGRTIAFCRTRNNVTNLFVYDLSSGEVKQITNYDTGHTQIPFFSPDGSEIAYAHMQEEQSPLHIISLATSQDRIIDPDAFVSDWSKNGQYMALFSGERSRRNIHSLLSIDGNNVSKTDLSLPRGKMQYSDMRISPDAQYLTYARQGNLFLYSLSSKNEVQLTYEANEDQQPLWTQDDKKLVFLSKRSYGPDLDLCVLSVVDGQTNGEVNVIRPDIGESVWLISLSDRGSLLYEVTRQENYIYTLKNDPNTDQTIKLASGSYPVWSPDGNQIAYLTKENTELHVMSADGSNDQYITTVDFPTTGTFAWGGDNIYIPEFEGNNCSIYAISVRTKQKRPVLLGQDVERITEHLTCSPDGKQIAFPINLSSGSGNIFVVDNNGENLKQITFYEESYVFYPEWSSDGTEIAYNYMGNNPKSISVVSIDDGSIKEVFKGNTPRDRFFLKSWSPDNKKIIYGTASGLRVGDIADGTSFPLELNEVPIRIDWSPDGTSFLFFSQGIDKRLMILDKFLPESTISE